MIVFTASVLCIESPYIIQFFMEGMLAAPPLLIHAKLPIIRNFVSYFYSCTTFVLKCTLRGSPYPELSKNRFFLFCFIRWNYYQRILSQNFTVHIGIVLMVEFRAVALRKLIFHRLKTLKRVFSKLHFSKLRARLKKNH